ncbi:MAG: 4-(cytidine 5'-diphospho)-2-C-methyl-D-erythritol kinase [Lentimicrobium sp.]|nr:4-(cytidine 5'-diphospho)-2-C-methyl-D-erythritol kinase [Lentimicrobium sp.]
MINFPHAKINLGLKVIRKRSDGFHDIETILYPIGLSDALEIVPAKDGVFEFQSTGIPVLGSVEGNLCVKAFRLIQQRYKLPEVKIHLHKIIPAGAGLGGGSSDAAFTLKLVSRIFSFRISEDELLDMASVLGSDCSFYIEGMPAFCTGRGEVLQNISLNLAGWHLVIVMPGILVSTLWAYQQIVPSGESLPVSEINSENVEKWKTLLTNDFENPVMHQYPVIRDLRDKLLIAGAEYAAMSGSGSSVIGLFKKKPDNLPEKFNQMFVWQEVL